MKKSIFIVAAFFAAFSCNVKKTETAQSEEREVNIYTHRHYDTDKMLFEQFTQETGIRVNVITANADQLMERLASEGENSPADLLVTVDAGRLYRAKEKGLFQPAESEKLSERVPAAFRDPEGHWFGLTVRARVVVYAKDRVSPDELSTYASLTDPNWKDRILVRSSGNIYNQSLLASFIAHGGKDGAKEWAEGMVTNFARTPKGNDRDQMKAIAAGEGDIAIVNTYYLGKLLHSEDEAEREVGQKIGVFFPNQEEDGTHINISGIGLAAHAPNREEAILLMEFLTDIKAQELFSAANHEYPVNPKATRSELLESWGNFKADTLDFGLLGQYNTDAVKVFDEAGWQ